MDWIAILGVFLFGWAFGAWLTDRIWRRKADRAAIKRRLVNLVA